MIFSARDRAERSKTWTRRNFFGWAPLHGMSSLPAVLPASASTSERRLFRQVGPPPSVEGTAGGQMAEGELEPPRSCSPPVSTCRISPGTTKAIETSPRRSLLPPWLLVIRPSMRIPTMCRTAMPTRAKALTTRETPMTRKTLVHREDQNRQRFRCCWSDRSAAIWFGLGPS